MKVELTILNKDIAGEELHQLTNDLCQTIRNETDIEADFKESESLTAGTKGEPISLSMLMLTFLSSGAAVALFNVIKAYFERNSSLNIQLQREDGKKLTINSENINKEQINKLLSLAEDLGGGKND